MIFDNMGSAEQSILTEGNIGADPIWSSKKSGGVTGFFRKPKKHKPPKKKKETKQEVPTRSPSVISPLLSNDEEWYPDMLFHVNKLSIKLTAYKFKDLDANSRVRYKSSVTQDNNWTKYTFYFLAPNEFIEPLNHIWEPYDSLSSRIAEKASVWNKIESELRGISSSPGGQKIVNQVKKAFSSGSGLQNSMNAAASAIEKSLKDPRRAIESFARMGMNAKVSTNRVDSPLVYRNSSRRTLDFVFPLFTIGNDETAAYNDVVYPIRVLQFLSSPGIPDSSVTKGKSAIAETIPPYVFEISTVFNCGLDKVNFIHVNCMVLRSLQATYRGPYIGGFPSSAELQVSFEQLDPTWDRTYFPEKEAVINVTS